MTKVVKLLLISEQKDKNGEIINYMEVNRILWDLQRQTREIKNKSVQLCWEWSGFSSEYNREYGVYPKEKDFLKYTLAGYVNDKFKIGYDLYSANNSSTTREVCTAFNNARSEMLNGSKSVLSYRANQPLELHNKSILFICENGEIYVIIKLLNRSGAEKYGFGNSVRFRVMVRDKSSKNIIERCKEGIYNIAGSKLIYNKKKKVWCLNLSYSFNVRTDSMLDMDKILGVDIGVVCPLCASVFGDLRRLVISGGEIEEFRRRTEARKRILLKQGITCGDGRIGHGRKKRNEPAYKIEDRIARFRDTANHKYSRALIEFAVKNRCGVIQMENLKGIAVNADKFLKNWSYYDLQTKIENKAKEAGIIVAYIRPEFTSQRCSKCGCIHRDNRPEQARFKCLKCGFEENADYNASQNIAIRKIDKIIEQSLVANAMLT